MAIKETVRKVGIDYGQARIGVAVSDPRNIIASPLTTVRAEKKSEDTVKKLIKTLNDYRESDSYVIGELVIGLPLRMNGKFGLAADEVLHFVELLKKETDIPITTWDERLTTVQAERTLREFKMNRKKRSKIIDTVSATIILQSYLDSKGSLTDLYIPSVGE